MSINKTKAFVTSDGKVFLTQEEAQVQELSALLASIDASSVDLPRELMKHKEALIAILTTRKPRTPKAKPAAKKSKPQIVTEAA